MSEILNFSTPYGDSVLNFGIDDSSNYAKYKKILDIDYELYPFIYIELLRVVEENKNLVRYFRYSVKDLDIGTTLTKYSTPYIRYSDTQPISIFIDVSEHKYKNIEIKVEIYIEQIEDNMDNKAIKDFKMFLGK